MRPFRTGINKTCQLSIIMTMEMHTPMVNIHINHGVKDDIVVVRSLKECATQKDVDKGRQLHANVLKRDLLQTNIFVGNTLVNFYVSCYALARARQVFDELLFRDLVSWNALIKGYAQHGRTMDTLNCFKLMQQEGLVPDIVSLACMLDACGSIGVAEKGQEIHAQIVREGLQNDPLMLGSALINMYTKCGALVKAKRVFEELPIKNVVSWTALIGGYCQHGQSENALTCFERMKAEGLRPDSVTYACILKACGSIGALERGGKLHDEIVKHGFLRKSTTLGNALVDMYTKLGEMKKARVVFNELRVQNVVSWTTMMGGYCNHGQGEEALDCFFSMGKKEIYPNAVTFSCALKACGIVRAIRKGSEIHAELARQGFPKDNALVGNALLDMYAKCSVLGMAKQAFVELPVRDIVSWNILIAGYSEHGLYADSLKCFGQMKHKGYSPDAVTYASILKACGNIGAANQGTLIHSEISENRILRDNIILGNALVDLYAKCGDLTEAQIVFNDLKVQDVVSWTSLIAGYCEHGHDEEALVCFEEMKQRGPLPNAITFVCILKACSNIGVLERGEKYFESMTTTYGIVPNSEHHTSLVMLYSHAGCFDKAMAVAKKMPSTDRLPAYFAILHACQKWGNVQIGRLAFEHAFALDKASAVPYIFMNSLHISADIQYADNMEVLQLMNNDSLI